MGRAAGGRWVSELTSIEDLKPSPYNPREISPEAFTALKHSVGHFGDISGLTWNSRSGHLVTGHQRMKALRSQWGDRLKLDNHSVVCPNGDRWPIRVVDWDDATEKAANVAANSPEIVGEFTPELKTVLDEIKTDLPDLSQNLRLDRLSMTLDSVDVTSREIEMDSYTLMFKFTKDDAAYVQERLHTEREDAGETLDLGWRETCLLRLLRKTD